MDICKYEILLKVIEIGSLTKAAEILGYTQPGLSHILNTLESYLGVKVLKRDRSGIEITLEGREIIPFIETICEDQQNLQRKLNEMQNINTKVIKIGSMISVTTHVIPTLVEFFQKKYPEIKVEVYPGHFDEIEEWIRTGRVDVGFVVDPPNIPLKTYEIRKDPINVVVPCGHPLEKLHVVPQSELLKYPFVIYGREADRDWGTVKVFKEIKETARYIANDDNSVLAMVERNLGICLGSDLVLKRTPYHVSRRRLEPPASRTIILVTNHGKKPQAIVDFIEVVLNAKNSKSLWA